MPVTVSATINHTHWPLWVHSFACLVLCVLTVQVFAHGYFIIVLLIVFWVAYRRFPVSPYRQVQWHENEVCLITDAGSELASWTGFGRQSFAFISLELNNHGRRHSFVIWRDQVSDASWRALNLAFNVWQSGAKAAH